MPLGILEARGQEHVPGTTPLENVADAAIPENGIVNGHVLKYDKSGKTILVPQPSDDPNDPLNWPRWRKEMFLVAALWGTACVGAIGPLLVAAYVQLSEEWGVSLATFSSGTNGGVIVCLAGATLIVDVLAVQYGKRPVYLVTSVGLVATAFWGSASRSFGSFVASRAISGVCMAPMEGLIPAPISNLWFVHERGTRTALYNLAFLAGVSVGPLIAGQLIQHYSWRVCSYAMAAALVIQLILTFFFMPETAYHRPAALNIDQGMEMESNADVAFTKAFETTAVEKSSTRGSTEPKKSFSNELHFWSGYHHDIPILKTLLGALKMVGSPIVLWSCVVFMTAVTWIVLLTIGASQIFFGPPYSFSISEIGDTFLSPFIFSVIGTIVAKPVIDGGVMYLAKRNHGIFEPEFRLPALAAYVLFTATGFFAAGQSLGSGMAWEIPVIIGLGFINFGIVLTMTVAVTYVIDCHREKSAEAISVLVLAKNLFAFASTYYANDWIASKGVRSVFFTLGGITTAIGLSGIPMYIYGKRLRASVARRQLTPQRR